MYNRDVYHVTMFNKELNDRERGKKQQRYNHYKKLESNTIQTLQKMFPYDEMSVLHTRIMKNYIHKTTTTKTITSHIEDYKKSEIKGKNESNYYVRLIPVGKRGVCWIKQYYGKRYILFGTFKSGKYYFQEIDLPFQTQFMANNQHGTILYGCLYEEPTTGKRTFVMEHVCLFQSKNIMRNYSVEHNLKFQQYIMEHYVKGVKDAKHNNTYNNAVQIALTMKQQPKQPKQFQKHNHDDDTMKLTTIVSKLEFPVYAIQLYTSNTMIQEYRNCHKIKWKQENTGTTTFIVKPDIHDDVYMLYDVDTQEYKGNMLIQNYKQSVYMNSLFRNIKENECLDLLEESDDEEDFEDVREDKYIMFDEKTVDCCYNAKFNGWMPRMDK